LGSFFEGKTREKPGLSRKHGDFSWKLAGFIPEISVNLGEE
jgi:hypothetical protein